jgi:hypothetical protein
VVSIRSHESLEAMLDDDTGGTIERPDGMQVKEIISELDSVLNQSNFYAKSKLSQRNIRGILRANAFQNYLESTYGFRILVLDKLILDKMQISLSADGAGRHEIAGIVEKGTMKIEAKSGMDLTAEKLFGGISR